MSKRIDLNVKGGREAFFDSPETDRLLAMLMRLVTEHWALKERVLVLEKLLAEEGILDTNKLDEWRPDPETDASFDMQSFELIQAIVESGKNIKSQ